jgi:hypothetical protein
MMIPQALRSLFPRDSKPVDFIQCAKDVRFVLQNIDLKVFFVDNLTDDN